MPDLFLGLAPVIVSALGAVFDVRVSPIATARHDLRKGGNAISALVLAEPFNGASGALRLSLPGGGEGLTGMVPAGLALTIGAYAYAVTVDAVAEDDGLAVVVALNLAEGQAAPAPFSAGASVAVAAKVDFALPASVEHGVSAFGISADLFERASVQLFVPRLGAPAYFRPRKNMIISGATNGPHILIAEPLTTGGSWSLLLGRWASPTGLS